MLGVWLQEAGKFKRAKEEIAKLQTQVQSLQADLESAKKAKREQEQVQPSL